MDYEIKLLYKYLLSDNAAIMNIWELNPHITREEWLLMSTGYGDDETNMVRKLLDNYWILNK